MRVRGLKLTYPFLLPFPTHVAPRAGAWIETEKNHIEENDILVAPRAGAWIETNGTVDGTAYSKSHPVRVRGLKLADKLDLRLNGSRTPCGCVD